MNETVRNNSKDDLTNKSANNKNGSKMKKPSSQNNKRKSK